LAKALGDGGGREAVLGGAGEKLFDLLRVRICLQISV